MSYDLKARLPHLKDVVDKYWQYYRRLEVPAKTVLLREGEVSQRSFFIEKGCLRVWFDNRGKDVTFQFFFENEGLASAESFRKSIPSIFTIETVEPSVIYAISKQDFQRMTAELSQDPLFMSEMMEILFERQLHYMNEFMSFIRDTPQQRYMNLVNEKPHIVQRIPQHYIASYLGITSVSLSRIRNKLLKEKKI